MTEEEHRAALEANWAKHKAEAIDRDLRTEAEMRDAEAAGISVEALRLARASDKTRREHERLEAERQKAQAEYEAAEAVRRAARLSQMDWADLEAEKLLDDEYDCDDHMHVVGDRAEVAEALRQAKAAGVAEERARVRKIIADMRSSLDSDPDGGSWQACLDLADDRIDE